MVKKVLNKVVAVVVVIFSHRCSVAEWEEAEDKEVHKKENPFNIPSR